MQDVVPAAKITKKEIATVIVLYNPGVLPLDIYRSFSSVGFNIFVDNSEQPVEDALCQITFNYEYIYNGNNGGIAGALNQAALKARELGFKWLLTVDQDSAIGDNSLQSLLQCIESTDTDPKVAIFAPSQHYMLSRVQRSCSGLCCEQKEVGEVMSSGSLVNLDIWNEIGGFREEYFIDAVDQEYCRRSKAHGFRVIECQEYLIDHNLGHLEHRTLFGLKFGITNHNHIRYYYIFRNTLVMSWEYRKTGFNFVFSKMTYLVKLIIKVALFEKSKLTKFRWICRGLAHGFLGKMGKL